MSVPDKPGFWRILWEGRACWDIVQVREDNGSLWCGQGWLAATIRGTWGERVTMPDDHDAPSSAVTNGPTTEVRILVRADVVDGEAAWSAHSWGGAGANPEENMSELREMLAGMQDSTFTDNPRYSWVTARVPLPAETADVEGKVEDGGPQ